MLALCLPVLLLGGNYNRVEAYQVDFKEKEIQCLAENIYFEARGEPLVGRIAVGQVVLNRVKSKKFPSTVCGVVFQAEYNQQTMMPKLHRCQFTWWCDGKPEEIKDYSRYVDALILSEYLLTHPMMDVTEGATYYHSAKVRPRWSFKKQRVSGISNHIFYRET